MTPARFEPAVPAVERPQTSALDRAATGIENVLIIKRKHLFQNCNSTLGYDVAIFALFSLHKLIPDVRNH